MRRTTKTIAPTAAVAVTAAAAISKESAVNDGQEERQKNKNHDACPTLAL